MMNTDGTPGGNNMGLGQADDQQMITPNDRENYIARLTNHFNGDRELAKQYDDEAIARSSGKAVIYKKVLHMLLQQRTQQIQQIQQQQQQQQQSMMNSQQQQQQQQSMYMPSQQTSMVGMSQQQQQPPPPTYTIQAPLSSSIAPQTASMMNIKQEPQPSMVNVQMRPNPQNFPMQQQQQQQHQQQQQIKQELMIPPIPQQQQQIKQELMVPPGQQQQQQPPPGVQAHQMRQQQQQQQPMQYNQQQPPPQPLPNQSTTTTPQQRNIAQQLQQVRQQSYLNQQQQQQQESSNSLQLQQQPSNPSTLPPSSSMNGTGPPSSSTSAPTTSAGSSDEILQQLLTSPNPPKQPSTVGQNVAQARLRTINRNVRNQAPQTLQQQQHPSPMTPGSDPMMVGNVPSPHSHPGMMQQPQTPIGPPGQSPLARYMMAQSPQTGVYRPQMSPMNMMNYAGSPTTMIDDEMHYLFKYFTDRIHYLTRIITRCQQEGQHDKVAKYRQLHDQMAAFVRNPIPEHLMGARRLKDHVDRILDPRMFGPVMMPPMADMTGMISANNNPNTNNSRLMTNGIFEQCQRAIVDYLGKDTTLKYNVAKRFLEPLSEVLNGVPHKSMRLDSESKQNIESYPSESNTQSLTSLVNIIESEFAHLSMNTFTYELKPLSDKMSSSTTKIDRKDLTIQDYELICRFIEIDMPIVPPLKIKLTVKYPHESPEVLSLTSTTLNLTPAKLEHSDGHSFFELISRNFIYFLFKLPAQHTITDILDIWRTAIRNASFTHQEI